LDFRSRFFYAISNRAFDHRQSAAKSSRLVAAALRDADFRWSRSAQPTFKKNFAVLLAIEIRLERRAGTGRKINKQCNQSQISYEALKSAARLGLQNWISKFPFVE
jgi:hypothetical protein